MKIERALFVVPVADLPKLDELRAAFMDAGPFGRGWLRLVSASVSGGEVTLEMKPMSPPMQMAL